MRVLIDTNVFISYLLNPHSAGVIQGIFRAWGEGRFTLLLPELLLDEIMVTVTGKPHLRKKTSSEELKEFLDIIGTLGEVISKVAEPIPKVTRDPKDDYLLAYALVGAADYLITGDEDLLALNQQIQEMTILSPREFSAML